MLAEWGDFKVNAKGGGTAVVISAAAWVYVASLLAPHIDSQPDHQTVTVSSTDDKLRVAMQEPDEVTQDPFKLKSALETALSDSSAKHIFEIEGREAHVDPATVQVFRSGYGYGLSAKARAGGYSGDVYFDAKASERALEFHAHTSIDQGSKQGFDRK